MPPPVGEKDGCQARVILEIADCSNRVNPELEVHSELHVENWLHELDTRVRALVGMRAGLIVEGHLHRERQAEVDPLDATLR